MCNAESHAANRPITDEGNDEAFGKRRQALDQFNLDYIEMMLPALEGVRSVLDVGSLDVNGSPRSLFASRGIDYTGCDIEAGPGVDVVVNIAAGLPEIRAALGELHFDLVVSLNTLEHIFEPVKALDNMTALVRESGYLLVVAPVVWEPHQWPHDFYRFIPDFFTTYARTRELDIVKGSMKLSVRDTRAFSDDLSVMPARVGAACGGSLKRKLSGLCKRFVMPGLKEAWPRTSLNVTLRKQRCR